MKIRNMKQVGERVKEIKMKRLFRRNQIIITTLAVMIAAAGKKRSGSRGTGCGYGKPGAFR